MTEKRKDIIKRLKERGYNTKTQEFNKNGVKLLGLVFTDYTPSPVIYDFEQINIDEIIKIIENSKLGMDISKILDIDNIKENILMGLQRKGIDENLFTLPCSVCDELEIYFYINLKEGIIKIPKAMKVIDENMIDVAYQNTIKEVDVFKFFDELTVISNKKRNLGAISIIFVNFIAAVKEQMNCEKLVVLPSSIHEVIVEPYNGNTDISVYTEMVQSVNNECVPDTEKLLDKAFII